MGVAAVAQLGGFGEWASFDTPNSATTSDGATIMMLHSVREGNADIAGGFYTTFGPSSVLFYLVAYSAANLTAFFAIPGSTFPHW